MNTPPQPDTIAASSGLMGTTGFELAESAGIQIGRYSLLTKLGEGGMGSVWAARQTEPVKRDVALKLIRPGMDSASVLARFDQERQALAVMNHPNIAKVFDGGLTPEGRPFFVMELVAGPTLNVFCDQQKLNIRERLVLFVKICQAVQHAHQKGIIHRDLKPANILVTHIDGQPVPKIIDFGVAKAISGKLTDNTLTTQLGNVIGTLEYMAPEQAGTTTEDIDTRADIYSLGVILYELLTGLRPFDAQRLRKAALLEAIRIIKEEDPSKPSTRVSTSESLPSLAALRQMEPKMLTRSIKGDLDLIVMKALEKDRNRRYDTANAFAGDVMHYLTDEPVYARPPSAWYRLSKFARRHRAVVIAAGLIALTLVLGLAGTSWGYVEALMAEKNALKERDEKDKARKEALKERDDKEKARAEAVAQGKQAVAVATLLESVFEGLNPAGQSATQMSLKEKLQRQLRSAGTDLETKYAGEPLVKARLQKAIGISLLGLGDANQAEKVLTAATKTYQAQPAMQAEVLETQFQLGLVQQLQGRYAEAVKLLEQVRNERTQLLGKSNDATLMSTQILASLYIDQDKTAESIKLLDEVLAARKEALGEMHELTLTTMTYLGDAYLMAKQYDKAVLYLEKSYRGQLASLSADNQSILKTIDSLASAYADADRSEEGVKLLEQSLQVNLTKFGPDHFNTMTCDSNLARALLYQGKVDEAVKRFERVRDQFKRVNGPDHPSVLAISSNLASGYKRQRELRKAIQLLEQIRDGFAAQFGTHHTNTLSMLHLLGDCYSETQRYQEAATIYEIILQRQITRLGRLHTKTLSTQNFLAVAYGHLNRIDDSIRLQREVYLERKATMGMKELLTQNALDHLATAYQDAKRFPEAAAAWRELLTAQKDQPLTAKPTDPSRLRSMIGLGYSLLQSKDYARAEPVLREVLTHREKLEPDDWRTFNTKVMLGQSLLMQKKYTDAEPFLTAGYEGLKARIKKVPEGFKQQRLGDALQSLLQLSDEKKDPEQRKKWEAEKAWLQTQGK